MADPFAADLEVWAFHISSFTKMTRQLCPEGGAPAGSASRCPPPLLPLAWKLCPEPWESSLEVTRVDYLEGVMKTFKEWILVISFVHNIYPM